MAAVDSKSTQITALDAGTCVNAPSGKAELMALFFDIVPSAGDANSTFAIVELPPGEFRFMSFLSKLYHSAFGTGRTLDVGWDAYVEPDGTPVAASEAGLTAAADVSSAGSFSPGAALTSTPVGQKVFKSRAGIRFRCKVEAAALAASEQVSGWLMFGK